MTSRRPKCSSPSAGNRRSSTRAAALFDEGDEVITHAPYWPTIPEQVKLMGATPVIVTTRSDDGFARARRGGHRRDHAEDEGDHLELAEQSDRSAHRREHRRSHRRLRPRRAASGSSSTSATSSSCTTRFRTTFRRCCSRAIAIGRCLPGSASKSYAMTGWRCGWSNCAEGRDRRVQRDPGAVDVEHHVDHTEGGAGGDQGPAGCRLRDARRVSNAARQYSRLADGPSRDRVLRSRRALSICCPTSRDCCRRMGFARPLNLPRHSSSTSTWSWCPVRRSMRQATSAFLTRRRWSGCAKGRRACFASSNRCNRLAPARRTDRAHNLS